MIKNKFLFWQPSRDFFNHFSSTNAGQKLLVYSNYLIWIFFFFISYLLIKNNYNAFWQILIATIIGEIIEKTLKEKKLWKRPFHQNNHRLPQGFFHHWYQNGSFPSGHTIKTAFFLLFIIQYQVFNPVIFLSVTLPLLIFRVVSGFHYPIDVFGGGLFGYFVWLLTHQIYFPSALTDIVKRLFNFVFFIK